MVTIEPSLSDFIFSQCIPCCSYTALTNNMGIFPPQNFLHFPYMAAVNAAHRKLTETICTAFWRQYIELANV